MSEKTLQIWLACLSIFFLTLGSMDSYAKENHAARIYINGPIGPATADYLKTSLTKATEQGATLAIIEMDTPGGLDASTRDIIKLILDSTVPIATYVYPAGARAASAGTYILYASHIAAMAPSTTLGAATPVSLGSPVDSPNKQDQETNDSEKNGVGKTAGDSSDEKAMRQKVVNDSVAYIRALAQRHGRNSQWAEKAVREAATLTANEALQKNVIDILANDGSDLISKIDGMSLTVDGKETTLYTADLAIINYTPNWRQKLLAVITNPQIAYILLLIGIYGLIFEGYSPGAMLPGVVGIISLLLGLYAMHILPINYVGLALIIVGALLTAAELFMPSFGVLGFGGIVALVFGSVMLIDTEVPGLMIPPELIAAVVLVNASLLIFLFYFVGKSIRLPRPTTNRAQVNQTGQVVNVDEQFVQVRIHGEIWRAQSDRTLHIGDQIIVVDQKGLTLVVKLA